MSRIKSAFERLNGEGRKALIPFITAGDPDAALTLPLMHTLVEAGADVIELGVPFSDPMADGPVIQKASERALARGVGLRHVLDWVREFRVTNATTPVVLMGYANPIERFDQRSGNGAFVAAAAEAGVDGVLVVDYPPEECEAFAADLHAKGLDLIFLLAPTSTDERIKQVGRIASGYVYYVSLKGVTGAGHLDTAAVAQMLRPTYRKTGLADLMKTPHWDFMPLQPYKAWLAALPAAVRQRIEAHWGAPEKSTFSRARTVCPASWCRA